MQGNLSQISLTDLLLLATTGKKSGLLKLVRGKEAVEVYLADGIIVHAVCPIGEGEKAILYPVTWGEGTFDLSPHAPAASTTIQKSAVEILDEVRALTHEWEIILELIPTGKVIFRVADLGEHQSGPITVPNVGWRILSKLDGVRSLQDVAEVLRIPYAYIAKVIYNLHKSGLVEIAVPIKKLVVDIVPPALLNRVTGILTEVIGPMAPLVLRDQIEALGESLGSFPESKLDELITLVSREIADGQLKNRFEESMFQEISNFKQF